MEAEKKRKKAEIGTVESGGGRRRKKEAATTPPPTEEEVEEFFAILRRMRVAVKYFENNNINCDTPINLTDSLVPVKTTVTEPIDDVKGGDNGVLDLNSIPDGESNSD